MSLTQVLTPASSEDLLQAIKRRPQSKGDGEMRRPYVIVLCGANGVGKSTTLSKVAFWLLQNKLKVKIAACDTFRSGAVEQLRMHVRNLEAIGVGEVQLFERGYGKDASAIARESIAEAQKDAFDVVLVDTAGRMQDNEVISCSRSNFMYSDVSSHLCVHWENWSRSINRTACFL